MFSGWWYFITFVFIWVIVKIWVKCHSLWTPCAIFLDIYEKGVQTIYCALGSDLVVVSMPSTQLRTQPRVAAEGISKTCKFMLPARRLKEPNNSLTFAILRFDTVIWKFLRSVTVIF
jgi:hypothetical protein